MPIVINVVQLCGIILEIIGVLFMANYFLQIRWYQIPKVVLTSFYRSGSGKSASVISDFTPEDKLTSLQGLSFLFLGFLIQGIAIIISLLTS